ncbi:MAG: VIT1/CCC1 transporter family protein [Chloroflexota bacterium]|nr:VIT1/CCC1 transporter family protein [Chloroflexota bacterium]
MFSRLPFIRPRELPDPTAPHETRLISILRPVVFGANDGLVSNLALVMGVAGARPSPGVIVLAGVAGVLAGAFSMGVGEFISVRSQQELLAYQLAFQHRQLREEPEQERRILCEIYQGRGFTDEEARHFVDRLFADPDEAARLLIFEEVGLDARSIGSPYQAGISSFFAFTLGALVPLVPYLLASGPLAFEASIGLSLVALFLLGVGISVLTHRSPLLTGLRQVLLGGIAAAVTFGVGSLIAVSA